MCVLTPLFKSVTYFERLTAVCYFFTNKYPLQSVETIGQNTITYSKSDLRKNVIYYIRFIHIFTKCCQTINKIVLSRPVDLFSSTERSLQSLKIKVHTRSLELDHHTPMITHTHPLKEDEYRRNSREKHCMT